MNHKQSFSETLTSSGGWVLHCRPEKISQPWSVVDTFEDRLSAVIRAHQVSADYFMVKVTDPNGGITWSS